jgi:hypothetical protein
VASLAILTVAIALAYFTRVRLPRPPIGVLGLRDVAILLALIVAMPYLYLALPPAVVSGLIALGLLSTLTLCLQPLIGRARWLVVPALLVLDVLLVSRGSPSAAAAANDAVAMLTVAAVANMWAQGGVRARDAAILAGVLAVYDPIATTWLGQTGHLFRHMLNMPLAPLLVWPGPHGRIWAIGAGDVLVAALMPAVIAKAFGTIPAMVTALGTTAAILIAITLVAERVVAGLLPVMVILGPVAVGCWLLFRGIRPWERTTYECRVRLQHRGTSFPTHSAASVQQAPSL